MNEAKISTFQEPVYSLIVSSAKFDHWVDVLAENDNKRLFGKSELTQDELPDAILLSFF